MLSPKLSSQTVIASTIIFMFFNALLPLNFSVQAEATKHPFNLSITLEKTTYRPGEEVNVTWTLTNISDENLTLYHSADSTLDFIIRDNNFDYIFRYTGYHSTAAVYYPLSTMAPSDSKTTMGTWEQIYDGSGSVSPIFWYRQVPPGAYYVLGVFRSSTYGLEFETPPLRITIT
jgi:hypothetical protein